MHVTCVTCHYCVNVTVEFGNITLIDKILSNSILIIFPEGLFHILSFNYPVHVSGNGHCSSLTIHLGTVTLTLKYNYMTYALTHIAWTDFQLIYIFVSLFKSVQ